MKNLFERLFGCWHKNYSFPLTSKKQTYVVCLDCGKEFPYDWKTMKRLKQPKAKKAVA